MSSSVHANNKARDILILGGLKQGFTQGLEDAALYAEKSDAKFCLSLHCNGANSYLFVNGTLIHKIKAKDSEIITNTTCFGNISGAFLETNMKNTGL